MANDHKNSKFNEFCRMQSIASVYKSYKSLFLCKNHKKSFSLNSGGSGKKLQSLIRRATKASNKKNQQSENMNNEVHGNVQTSSPRALRRSLSNLETVGYVVSQPSGLSTHSQPLGNAAGDNILRRNQAQLSRRASAAVANTAATPSLVRNMSRGSVGHRVPNQASFSRSSSTTRIMYSNSNGVIKPPAVERTLACSLEDMCFGCIKKIRITKDVTNDGQIVEETEILSIKVKPGWKSGIKVTFDGMASEKPGGQNADLIFVVTEKKHPLFRRDGDDLVLTLKIPLVEALSASTVSIPLLAGDTMRLAMEDTVIYPGYEKIIAGEGMPKSRENGERGNLIVQFQVEFPKDLLLERRSEVKEFLHPLC